MGFVSAGTQRLRVFGQIRSIALDEVILDVIYNATTTSTGREKQGEKL